jgi:hypothetical protein
MKIAIPLYTSPAPDGLSFHLAPNLNGVEGTLINADNYNDVRQAEDVGYLSVVVFDTALEANAYRDAVTSFGDGAMEVYAGYLPCGAGAVAIQDRNVQFTGDISIVDKRATSAEATVHGSWALGDDDLVKLLDPDLAEPAHIKAVSRAIVSVMNSLNQDSVFSIQDDIERDVVGAAIAFASYSTRDLADSGAMDNYPDSTTDDAFHWGILNASREFDGSFVGDAVSSEVDRMLDKVIDPEDGLEP